MDAAKLEALHRTLADRLEKPNEHDKQRKIGRAKILPDREVDFYRVATVVIGSLRHYAKATAYCFALADKVVVSEGLELTWREQFKLGAHLLHQMVLMELCTIQYSDLEDYECYVVLLSDKAPRKFNEAATSEHPFPQWKDIRDGRGNFLTAPKAYKIPDWNFTGAPPALDEKRLWHPSVEREFLTAESQGHSITKSLFFDRPKEYQNNPFGAASWIRAANHVESNEYRINKEMLKLVDELDRQLPDKLVAIRNKDKRELFESLKERSEELAELDSFYQRCYFDYRGRMYLNRSIVNYQGDDMARSFIEFARGIKLNDEGFDALLLHAANLYEHKGSIKVRTEFARSNLKKWIAYADDALATYEQWRVDEDGVALDDPLQFIRACMELRDATTSKRLIRKKGFITHLPVEADQSNSVIQHLTSMRTADFDVDEQRQLARQSGLAAESDLYEQLAGTIRISEKIKDKERRKLIKKMLVPYVYGAGAPKIAKQWKQTGIQPIAYWSKTQRERAVEINLRRLEQAVPALRNFKRMTRELVRDLRRRPDVTETVVAPPNAITPEEIRRMRRVYIDMPLRYSLPSGFVMELAPYQKERKRERVARSRKEHYKTGKQGAAQIVAHEPISHLVDVDGLRRKIMSAVIHSLDATVAQKVCAHAFFPIIPIHDAWSCHANNAPKLRKLFSHEFTFMHQADIPWFVIRRDVIGDGLPVGILDYDEEQAAQIHDLYLEIEGFEGKIS
ncbi:MAG: hypothetical protein HOI21_14225 [Bacteroidetes Order II. Incertae sedis bacterium]|jgi:hypothetical protein|nr:hypothetical protein [Bacteroidetes Order II. bacterium]